jgi:gluconokinase
VTRLAVLSGRYPWTVPASEPLLVVMGVSGSGKTTVGELLATRLGVPFADADDLHSRANIALMAAGHPLTDEDRWPWLARVGAALSAAQSTGLVMACSALKRSYRDAILAAEPRARFVFLDGPRDLLVDRLSHRHGHFMPPELLDSQLAALEPLATDEPGVTVQLEADQDPATLVDEATSHLAR